MGMDCGTNGLVWDRGKSLNKTELKWLQLPLPPPPPPPPHSVLSFSSFASASALCWTIFRFQEGWTEMLASFLPLRVATLLIFLVLVSGGQVQLSSQMTTHSSLCWLYNLNREIINIERGWVLRAVIRRDRHTKKA